jgi:uncharacterized protein YgiM (DUF1202 family)
MRKAKYYLLSTFLVVTSFASADAAAEQKQQNEQPFTDFTGKIARDRVRLRLQPNLESPIVRELDRDDLLVVTGTVEDFFAVMPPKDLKAYVYRSFILDNVVQGNRVNVRLNPTLESPVIVQLNSGDKVVGDISDQNNKWLEIKLPDSLRFYISKDFIVKVGDANFITAIDNRKQEVKNLLSQSAKMAQAEIAKPFPEINLEGVYANLHKIINHFEDFPGQVKEAKELLTSLQETYLQKKVGYLESQTNTASQNLEEKNSKLAEVNEKLNKINREGNATDFYKNMLAKDHKSEITSKMSMWIPAEISHYEQWAKENDEGTIKEFYQQQAQSSIALKGILEAYNRPIRNKPGDFVLINSTNNLPIAYLYSTQVNLEDKIGQEISVQAVSRPNNHFAYPAFFVLKAE